MKRLWQNANTRVALMAGATAVAMVGAAFAAVPLYQLFCQVTGFDGTVRKAEAAGLGPATARPTHAMLTVLPSIQM